MGWIIGAGAYDNKVDASTAKSIAQVALNDSGKVLCLSNQNYGSDLPQVVVLTLDANGVKSQGGYYAIDNATWQFYKTDMFCYAPNQVVVLGAEGTRLEVRVLSISGTIVTIEQQTSVSFTGQPRSAFDYANNRGLCWSRSSNKLLAWSISGSVWTNEDSVAYSFGVGSFLAFGNFHDISYDIANDRYLIVWEATISAVSGIYCATCQLNVSNDVVNQTAPALISTTTRGALKSIHYHEASGKHVLLYHVDDERLELTMLVMDGAGAITQPMTPKILDYSVADDVGTLCVGEHPVTKDIQLFYSRTGLNDRWKPGRIVGNDIRLGDAEEPFPDLTTPSSEFSTITYEPTHGFTVLGMTRFEFGYPYAFIIRGRWSETQFIDLPPFTALGGDTEPLDVNISLPAFAMYPGQVCELSIDGELAALDVISFSASFDIVPTLSGTLGALTGSMNGGFSLFGDLAPLEGSMTLYNETTMRISGVLAPLEGSMSGVVSVVGSLSGQLGALDGIMYGGASINGELGALIGTGTGSVPLTMGIRGYLPPLLGSMDAETPGRAFLDGELAPLEAAFVVLEGELPALVGRMYMSVVEATTNIAYVMNKSTGAVTRYPDYDFSFALRWQGKQFLASPDGLFEYDREEDVPAPIAARFALPPSDYGETGEKRVPRVYLQGELAGQMRAGIAYDDDTERSSRVEGSPGVDKWRAKLPRGLKGHHFAVAVENVAGADFEIEQVDALIQITGRKI
jgi:hypothetical protein